MHRGIGAILMMLLVSSGAFGVDRSLYGIPRLIAVRRTDGSGLSPDKLKRYYGLPKSATAGEGETIAVVVAFDSPNAEADLGVFSSTFGLPSCTTQNGCFLKRPVGRVLESARSHAWTLETSLDIQWAHAIAPGARIVLVETADDKLQTLLAGVPIGGAYANQVSLSWGVNDCRACGKYDETFAQTGVTFLASSGDTAGTPSYPSTSPNVVSVGGTSIQVDAGERLGLEAAWSGGGGGPSAFEDQLAAQAIWYPGGNRGTPDVAADADPSPGLAVYDSFEGSGQAGWLAVGGTSASCPVWAAIFAEANASRSTPLLGSASPLYAVAQFHYLTAFNDITSGSNGYAASPGYDLATGLGSPKGLVISSLANF